MTKKELIAKVRAVKQEKLLKNLYEENKFNINKKGYIGYEAWRERVVSNLKTNPKYSDLEKKGALVSAGRKYLRTKEYIDQDRIGELYVREALKETKTGRMIKWGRKKTFNRSTGQYEFKDRVREETMYDVLRQKLGYFKKAKKLELFYDETTKSYHFIGADKLEYEIAIDKYHNVKEILLVNA